LPWGPLWCARTRAWAAPVAACARPEPRAARRATVLRVLSRTSPRAPGWRLRRPSASHAAAGTQCVRQRDSHRSATCARSAVLVHLARARLAQNSKSVGWGRKAMGRRSSLRVFVVLLVTLVGSACGGATAPGSGSDDHGGSGSDGAPVESGIDSGHTVDAPAATDAAADRCDEVFTNERHTKAIEAMAKKIIKHKRPISRRRPRSWADHPRQRSRATPPRGRQLQAG
jgi:hypothetical protein